MELNACSSPMGFKHFEVKFLSLILSDQGSSIRLGPTTWNVSVKQTTIDQSVNGTIKMLFTVGD